MSETTPIPTRRSTASYNASRLPISTTGFTVTPAAAMEQFDCVAGFQLLHLGGDLRLADIDRPRRGGEAPFGGNGMEGPELRIKHSNFQYIKFNIHIC